MNLLVPIVLFCVLNEHQICNEVTSVYKHRIPAVKVAEDGLTTVINTPLACLMAGYQDVAAHIDEVREQIKKEDPDHKDKELEFRVICERADQKV